MNDKIKRHGLALLMFGLILILGVGLRFWDLDRQSLWQDEIHTIEYMLDRPALKTVVQRVAIQDLHSPLYYALLRIELSVLDYLHLSSSGGHLRLLSAFLGSCALPVFFLLLRRLFRNVWVALLGMFLAAINIYGIYYSQELRMYSLILLLAPLILYFQLALWDADSGFNRYSAWGLVISSIMLLYTSLIGLFVVAGTWLALLSVQWLARKEHPERWKTIFWLGGIVFLCYLPWISAFWAKSVTLKDGVETGLIITNPRELWKFAFENLLYLNFKSVDYYNLINKAIRIFIPFSVLILFLKTSTRREHEIIILGFIVTFLLYFGLTYGKAFHTGRYFSAWWPFSFILIFQAFVGIHHLIKRHQNLRVAFYISAGLFGGLYLWGQVQSIHYYFNEYEKENWRAGVAYLNQSRRPGDYLLVFDDWEKKTLQYYKPNLPFITGAEIAANAVPRLCESVIYMGVKSPELKLQENKIDYSFNQITWPPTALLLFKHQIIPPDHPMMQKRGIVISTTQDQAEIDAMKYRRRGIEHSSEWNQRFPG